MISQKQLFVTVVGLASTLSLFLGSVLLFWTPALLSIHLRTTLPIVSENSVVFDVWHNPMTKNVRVRRQFWVFTILNPKQVCDGKRPQLQRRGPHVYERRRIRARDTISWIGHSIITYRYGDEYIFLREESIDARTGEQLDENDVITVYSIAFFSTVYRLSKFVIQRRGLNYTPVSQFIALSLIKCFSENPQDLTILEETSVSDFIWGEMEDAYLDKLSNFVNSLKLGLYVPKHIRLQYRESIPAPFTLYRDKPGETDQIIGKMCPVVDDLSDCPTSSNSFSGMYTGMSQPKDAGKLYMYNGLKQLPWWGPGGCSTLHDSTEGVQHRPGLQRTDRIKLFIDAIARSVEFRYDGEVRVRDVDGYRYVLSDETFQSQYTNPENECYFQHWQGFLNLTSVFFFPVYLSKPFFIGVEDRSRIHFDLVNEEVFASVEQDSLQWDSFLDINPLTGMPLQHKVSFQANMRIQSNAKGSLTSPTRNLADTLVPILLVTDWAVLSEEAAHPFNTLVRPALRLGRIIGCSLLLVSFILAVISWWLWVRAWPTRIGGGSSEHLHLELLIPEDPMSENRVHLHAR